MGEKTVFISYSHKDESWKDKRSPQLRALEKAGVPMRVWDDRKIDGGDRWYPEIQAAMENAAAAVLLISGDFLASDFCVKEEVPALLKRQEELGMLLIPVLVRPCVWKAHRWLKDMQLIPRDGKSVAVDHPGDQADEVFAIVAEQVFNHFEQRQSPPTLPIPRNPITVQAPWTDLPFSAPPLAPASAPKTVEFRAAAPSPDGGGPAGSDANARILSFDSVHPNLAPMREGTDSTQWAPTPPGPPAIKVDVNRLPKTGSALFGRDSELQLLDDAWDSTTHASTDPVRVLVFSAHGGVGKSTLVNHWLKDMSRAQFRGATLVFGWSFYSQGARQETTASADAFIDAALRFFGDADPTAGSPWDKGTRLAGLIGQQRALLILDGLEPLQAAQAYERGRLRDPALEMLLRGLARKSAGLCVVTTREAIPELAQRPGVRAHDLEQISPQAARALLRTLRVVGMDAELESLAERFGPHALTITLLGVYLYEHPGHGVGPAEALERRSGSPLDRVLAGFEEWLGAGPERDALQLLGLFDRPANAGCLGVLRAEPAIPGLTDHLVAIRESEWNRVLSRLEKLKLVSVGFDADGGLSIDAHPLLREYFARQLRHRGTGFQPVIQGPHGQDAHATAHRRLYEHLCTTAQEGEQPTLDDLQPLYQAVAHGCQAGLQQEACEKVYRDRINRGREAYSAKKLGAFGSDLGAVACFFEQPWRRVSPALTEAKQAWLLNEAATRLRALGRLTESLEPMRAGLEMGVKAENWNNAAIRASNLSELELTLGEADQAVADAEQSVRYADRSNDAFQRLARRTTHADALHQAGRRAEAAARFREAEEMQAERQPHYPLLYSLGGFQYCDLLLAEAERAAWQVVLRGTGFQPVTHGQDAHATNIHGTDSLAGNHEQGADGANTRGTGFQPVISDLQHGQDARATRTQAPVRFRQGAYLPHLTCDGGIYAVTFRLADSLPAHILEQWQRERESLLKKSRQEGRELSADERRRLRELFSDQIETFLDAGQGECWLRRDDIAGIVHGALQHFDGERYELLGWCVMPNHVHVVVQPRAGFELEKIVHGWKSFTAQRANAALQRSGSFWQPEYYDHLIRDEADLEHAVNYVLANPAKAGLADWPWVGSSTGFQPVVDAVDHGLEARATLDEVEERAAQTLYWWKNRFTNASLLDIAIEHLTLGRVALYKAIHDPTASSESQAHIAAAVSGLRRAGDTTRLPLGLLTRTWLHCLPSTSSGQALSAGSMQAPSPSSGQAASAGSAHVFDSAREDLDEAWEIAERGPMPLFLADIHLHRARLFFRVTPYPWQSPQYDLAAARRLITKHGYWRRKEELEDAEAVIGT